MLGTSLEQSIRRSGVGFQRLVLYLAAAVAAFTTLALLVVVGLFFDLLITRGEVLPAEIDTSRERPAAELATLEPLPEGLGIRPIVMRHYETPVLGGVLRAVYLGTPLLRNNAGCLGIYLGSFLLLSFVLALALYVLDRAAHAAAMQVTTAARLAIHQQAFQVGASELLSARASRSVTLFGPLAEEIQRGLYAWWRSVPLSLALLALLLLLALALNIWLTLTALFLVALAGMVAYTALKYSRQRQEHWSRRAQVLLRAISHQLGQTLLVAGYDLPAAPGEPAADTLRHQRQAAIKAATSYSAIRPLVILLAALSLTLLGLLVGVAVLSNPIQMPLSSAILWFGTLSCLVLPVTRLARLSKTLRPARSAAAEINAFLDRPPSVNEAADAQPLAGLAQQIEFSGVRLADRRGERLLDDIALTIPAGQKVAILSTNETLPATLAGLLLRFQDPAAGQVCFDGQDIRRSTLSSLRKVAAFVPAGGMIFTGSIAENIRCGENQFTDDEVVTAAKAAGVYERIASQSQGLETLVGERGIQVTDDFAFGIGLARALLRKPALLIAQHPVGEHALLQEELDKQILAAAQGRTTLLLTSRPSLLRQADRVIFFHKGSIAAAGTHGELLRDNDLYRHVIYIRSNEYQKQLS